MITCLSMLGCELFEGCPCLIYLQLFYELECVSIQATEKIKNLNPKLKEMC